MRYYDNTRISTYRDCPRKFYFRHVVHWSREGFNKDLVFGSSWHAAMDVIWEHANSGLSDTDLLKAAFKQFMDTWYEEGGPDLQKMPLDEIDRLKAKTPSNGNEMLRNYIIQRRPFLANECTVLSIEQPFAVPLAADDSEHMYIGRLDKVFQVKSTGYIHVGEHKTTGSYAKASGFRADYINSWSPNSQVDGYTHAAHMLHGSQVKGVWIDAALAYKNHSDVFKFIPIDRANFALNEWLHETRDWIKRIEADNIYPKNTARCYDYGRACTYRDICKYVSDPLEQNSPPDGMVVNKWEPFNVLGIANLGLPNE